MSTFYTIQLTCRAKCWMNGCTHLDGGYIFFSDDNTEACFYLITEVTWILFIDTDKLCPAALKFDI